MDEATTAALEPILKQLDSLGHKLDEIKLREENRRATEFTNAKLAAIVENSDDAIIGKTLDGIITTWNGAATRMYGYAANEAIGKSIHIIIPPDYIDEESGILRRLRLGERIDHFRTVRIDRDGRRIDVSLTVSPIRDADGSIVGVSKIARDISVQLRLEEELIKAKEAAEAALQAKDQFLAVLSHELRTPLTPVLAGLGLFDFYPDLPEELKAEIICMRRNVEYESRIIDDLLDCTRLSQGKMELHSEITDMHVLVQNVVAVFKDQIAEKALTVTVDLKAGDAEVWVDPRRMRQALWNIVGNAVKFTPKGGEIAITSGSSEHAFWLAVRDTGIGFDPAVLPRLFEPFEQGSRAVSRMYGGLGVGLSLARSILKLHQGTISAASAGPGKGATFTISLPGTQRPAPPQPVPPAAKGQPKNAPLQILVVEDNPDTLRLIALLLRRAGHVVTTSSTVQEAIRTLEAQRFDLLLSDIGLPDGDGWQIMQHARQQSVRGIAISGFGSPEDLRKSQDAGFELHLTKPIDVQKLHQVIERKSA